MRGRSAVKGRQGRSVKVEARRTVVSKERYSHASTWRRRQGGVFCGYGPIDRLTGSRVRHALLLIRSPKRRESNTRMGIECPGNNKTQEPCLAWDSGRPLTRHAATSTLAVACLAAVRNRILPHFDGSVCLRGVYINLHHEQPRTRAGRIRCHRGRHRPGREHRRGVRSEYAHGPESR